MRQKDSSPNICTYQLPPDYHSMAELFNMSCFGQNAIKVGLATKRTAQDYQNIMDVSCIVIAKANGELVGFISRYIDIKRKENEWTIGFPICHPEWVKATEKRLVCHLVEKARSEGIMKIWLSTPAIFQRAHQKLAKWGFKKAYSFYSLKTTLLEKPPLIPLTASNFIIYEEDDERLFWEVNSQAFGDRPDGPRNFEANRKLLKGNSLALLCYDKTNKKPIGQIIVKNGDVGTFSLAVIPKYQRQGIGTTLINHAMRYLWDQGTKTIEIRAMTTNDDAIRLYQKLGFQIIPVASAHVYVLCMGDAGMKFDTLC
jgi:ribosomal protein S18 acetylase RimI-like enzyme